MLGALSHTAKGLSTALGGSSSAWRLLLIPGWPYSTLPAPTEPPLLEPENSPLSPSVLCSSGGEWSSCFQLHQFSWQPLLACLKPMVPFNPPESPFKAMTSSETEVPHLNLRGHICRSTALDKALDLCSISS